MTSAPVGRLRRTRKHGGSPQAGCPLSDRGRSSAVAAFSPSSSLALLLVFQHLLSGVAALDVLDHTNSKKEIAAWAVETGRAPSGRRLRQEKEPLHPSASESSPSATKMEQPAARRYSPTHYLLDANGGGEALAQVTSAASRHGQPEPTAEGRDPSQLQRRGKNFAHSSALAIGVLPAAKRKENAGGYGNATEDQASPLGSTRTAAKTNSTSIGSSSLTAGGPGRETSGNSARLQRGAGRGAESVLQQEQGRIHHVATGARGSRAASKTMGALTVTAATASSEYASDAISANLIDGDITTYAHTSDNTADCGPAQKCPWFQLDLGETMTVDKVKLSAHKGMTQMRRNLFIAPMRDDNGVVEYEFGDDMTGGIKGGMRVLVGNSARDRADTSEFNKDMSSWSGTEQGSVCPEPPTGTECETIQCEDPATCLDRFVAEPTDTTIGTATVDCKGKQGRYVTIELPGVTATSPTQVRNVGLTEVAVEGGPAIEAAASLEGNGTAGEDASTTPAPEASARAVAATCPILLGIVLVAQILTGA
ncbi:unnamed protein product [Amoebophrya sp. A120]|nr:unnamed protein product [Amoebophrya sp. A120]|eukprot:GSA120T00010995001.1